MLAYHNAASIKSVILAELAMHRKADELVQGYGYWLDGKGCSVASRRRGGHMQKVRRDALRQLTHHRGSTPRHRFKFGSDGHGRDQDD